MRVLAGTGVYRVERRTSPGDLIVLEPEVAGAPRISLHGFHGNALPARLTAPVIETLSHAGRQYRLTAAELRVDFQARSVLAHSSCAAVLEPLVRPFALRPRQRLVVRVLLGLLRFRCGGALLAAWHASRR